jgi:hypothetical protein
MSSWSLRCYGVGFETAVGTLAVSCGSAAAVRDAAVAVAVARAVAVAVAVAPAVAVTISVSVAPEAAVAVAVSVAVALAEAVGVGATPVGVSALRFAFPGGEGWGAFTYWPGGSVSAVSGTAKPGASDWVPSRPEIIARASPTKAAPKTQPKPRRRRPRRPVWSTKTGEASTSVMVLVTEGL